LKLCLVSHSLVHPRQAIFAEELRKQGIDLLEVYPFRWGSLSRAQGYSVHSEGSIFEFVFGDDAIKAIEQFKPDWIYVQDEPNSLVMYQMSSLAQRSKSKLAGFTWENIKKEYAFPFQDEALRNCRLIVCGNSEAKKIMLTKNVDPSRLVVLPQVGVSTSMFCPQDVSKKISVVCIGRMSPEKGGSFIREAYPDTTFVTNTPYEQLPEIFNSAKVSVQFSHSVPGWKEQAGNYVNLEAMSCALPVVTSNCGAIPEFLEGSKAYMVKERDTDGLKRAIDELLLLNDDERRKLGLMNREFILQRFSNEKVASKLVEALSCLS